MKQILRIACCLTLLSSACAHASVLPYLSIRSQSINDARELVSWQTHINQAGMCNIYGSFSITPEYTRSFQSEKIARALFSDALSTNCCGRTSIAIQGSQVTGRSSNALMAENFYLPTDYSSVVSIQPRIDNFLVDLNMYIGLGNWVEGLFFRMHAPIVYSRWDLNYDEDILNAGTSGYTPGYFNNITTSTTSPVGLTRDFLLGSFSEYVTDGRAITGVPGISFDALENARWSRCNQHLTRVADLRMQLGWNFLSCDDYHLGLSLYAAAPTGNRPQGRLLFEPIIGNGHHWELGFGLTSHINGWKSEDECCSWDLYFDTNVTHLFKTRQCRTLDLCGKPLSRYMLMVKMGTPVTNLLAVDQINATVDLVPYSGFTQPNAQFQNEFQPVANISTIPVQVSAAAQVDLVLKSSWTYGNFQWDLGYNLWARSCEKLCSYNGSCCYDAFSANKWALKGDAYVYGFEGVYANPTAAPSDVSFFGSPLSASQSGATIFSGTSNWPDSTTLNISGYTFPADTQYPASSNLNIDNPRFAVTSQTNPENHLLSSYSTISASWAPVATSNQPVLLTAASLDFDAASQKGLSNKLFTHIGYTWAEHCGWTPFFGVGGEIEWGKTSGSTSSCNTWCHKPDSCNASCATNPCSASCKSFALSQWGVWVKTGVSFN